MFLKCIYLVNGYMALTPSLQAIQTYFKGFTNNNFIAIVYQFHFLQMRKLELRSNVFKVTWLESDVVIQK